MVNTSDLNNTDFYRAIDNPSKQHRNSYFTKKQGDSFLKQVEKKAPSGETVLKQDLGKEMSITKRTLLE